MGHFMKLDLYKIINIVLTGIVTLSVVGIYTYIALGLCVDRCSYEVISGLLKPLYAGGKVLAIILAVLLFVPVHIFRKWLYYIAPIVILITINRVIAVSVYSSSIGSIDKIHMAQLGMYFLGVVTIIFVVAHLIYDKKNQ